MLKNVRTSDVKVAIYSLRERKANIEENGNVMGCYYNMHPSCLTLKFINNIRCTEKTIIKRNIEDNALTIENSSKM